MNLTPRQVDVIVAIRNYRHLHGYSPTMQELADQLGTSKVTIFEHVGALEKKRVLRRDKHKARSLEITADEKLPDEERATKLPLLGNIAAGSPIEAIENREELDLEQMHLVFVVAALHLLRVRITRVGHVVLARLLFEFLEKLRVRGATGIKRPLYCALFCFRQRHLADPVPFGDCSDIDEPGCRVCL